MKSIMIKWLGRWNIILLGIKPNQIKIDPKVFKSKPRVTKGGASPGKFTAYRDSRFKLKPKGIKKP